MRRREFIAGLISAAAGPVLAPAQQAVRRAAGGWEGGWGDFTKISSA